MTPKPRVIKYADGWLVIYYRARGGKPWRAKFATWDEAVGYAIGWSDVAS